MVNCQNMSKFTILPAIDLKGGRCVRLRQGRADAETVYADDPVAVALDWEKQGAEWLHIVDLDGAFQGQPVHTEVIGRIAAALRIPVEVGGGLRTDDHADRLLELGVNRIIIGTRALSEPDRLPQMAARLGARLAVGLDARDGRVAVKGWTETTEADALTLAGRLEEMGVQTLIYTDIAQDGMLTGPNIPALTAVCDRVSCKVIASGGIATAAQVTALTDLRRPNLCGAIVGKALYDGKVTLAELKAGSNRP